MQLNVFSTDSQKSGFRLQYMEVYNWGTFNEHVYSIRPMGETSLLTGGNGSGKTTFVDALLTLIVAERKFRFYNQSSGSEKKGDRTEESYVLGGYGTISSENTGLDRTQYLRENKEEAYSILLANFSNETEQSVTLFQVRYFVNGNMERKYGIAHKSLHIEDDFRPFDLGGNWRRRLDLQYNKASGKQLEWFDTASKYAQRLVNVLGMQSMQALTLFNQTVGIKVLQNLDDFIRTHMLEPRDMETQFQELKKHLKILLDAQENIEKAEEQIKLLQPVQHHHEHYKELQVQVNELQLQIDTAKIWKIYTHDYLLAQAIDEGNIRLRELVQKIKLTRDKIERLIDEEHLTKNQIEQNEAGRRLKQLENDLEQLKGKKTAAETNLALFSDWCKTLRLEENNLEDEAAYNRIKKESLRSALRLQREQRLNEEDDFDAKSMFKQATEQKQHLEEELNILLQNRSNIPPKLATLRKDLCSALKIDTNDLPFSGELVQVRPQELHWQPTLEKLLYSFSLRLLVPDKHYKKVTRYINQTNLRTRLVYYHVKDVIPILADEETVFYKLDFHPDHKLTSWVQQQLAQQFNYVCIEDEKMLERYEKAITISGLTKNRDRHEKDDRPERSDPSGYVMGWNNETKKEAMLQKRGILTDNIASSNETILRCKKRSDYLQKQFVSVDRIKDHEGFPLLDVNGIQRSIHNTHEQIKMLRQSDNELKTLVSQLEQITKERKEKEDEKDDQFTESISLGNDLSMHEQTRESLRELLRHTTESDKDQLLSFQQKFADKLIDISLEMIEPIYHGIQENATRNITEVKGQLHREQSKLERSINHIKNPSPAMLKRFPGWYEDVQFLPEEAEYADEYNEWLQKLEKENLPKYRKNFENYINETITYKIGGLNEELERWERDINTSIGRLNKSLSGINFNKLPDTYIQLGKRQVAAGTEVREFRGTLLDALPQAANWQQSSFEEKSLHFRQKVQPLIASLDESESYRSKVMDARNWFEFWADEKYRNTDELKKTYRQMGQLSGGEKPQLTYTILCSAIAYQFGITREGKNNRSLRFIAVDESFSNQDEDKATYLMELCKQLHLQLLVVTPSDKIQIVQDFIAHVHLVQRVNNRNSTLYNMTIKELKRKTATQWLTISTFHNWRKATGHTWSILLRENPLNQLS